MYPIFLVLIFFIISIRVFTLLFVIYKEHSELFVWRTRKAFVETYQRKIAYIAYGVYVLRHYTYTHVYIY